MDALEWSQVSSLSFSQAARVLEAFEPLDLTESRRDELIRQCILNGGNPIQFAYDIWDAQEAYTRKRQSPIGPLPKRVEVRWPPPGVPESYWIRDDR